MSDLKTLHEKLHAALVKDLLKRIKDGTATAADLGVARQLLKDNGIDVNSARANKPLQELADTLPFQPGEDEPMVSHG